MFRQLILLPIFAFGSMLISHSTVSAADSDKKSEKPIIAVFRFDGAVVEKPSVDDFSLGQNDSTSLKDLVERFRKAAKDPNVKAIAVLVDGAEIGTAQREELRQAMAEFQASGKEIFAHADELHMGDYALFCGSSRLSLVPTADVWVTGMYGEQPYLRGLLDILGVQPDFLTCGAYKSAAELFMRSGPSPEAEKMENWLFDGIYDTYLKLIASGRKVDVAKAKVWVNNGPYTAEKAKAAGLIDAVEHRQEFEQMLKSKFGNEIVFERKYGEKKQPELDFSSPFAIFKLFADAASEAKKKKTGKPAVAIIYVDGAIQLGKKQFSLMGGTGGAWSSDLRKALNEAADDDNIKAVVLRVDSPGGSAVASEIILDATRRVKAKKPFIVSMGDVAGSGGYYVACAADTIFADSSTITGSIGVVAGKFVTNPMWARVGVNFHPYKRGNNAGMLGSDHVFTNEERAKMQGYMDDIYGVFKGHVVAIRGKKLTKPIDELAGGRVYTGQQALELGLVDKIGTMQDAIQQVAKDANLSEYDVRVVPEPKGIIEQILESTTGGKEDPHRLDAVASKMKLNLRGPSLLELAAPHLEGFDPVRVRAVKRALLQLQTLNREGVSLMMPEYIVK